MTAKCRYYACDKTLEATETKTGRQIKYCCTQHKNADYKWRHAHGMRLVERALETNFDAEGYITDINSIRSEAGK